MILVPFSFLQLLAPMPSDIENREQRIQELEAIKVFQQKQEFIRWADSLGYVETRNNWQKVNVIGCFGEWQFKESTLRGLGYTITLQKFKKDPNTFPRELQLEALIKYTEYNSSLVDKYSSLINTEVGGILITKSGILAAAHLAGKKGVERFLDSGGKINKRDLFKTSVATYLKRFQEYNL